MSIWNLELWCFFLKINLQSIIWTQGKGIPNNWCIKWWWRPWNWEEFSIIISQLWQTWKQAPRVWMTRLIENFLNSCVFNDFASIHDSNLVRDTCYDAKVMGNENDRETILLFEWFQEVNDLSLNGHIKGSCWFVTDKDIRTTSQGNGNNDTLTHPTRVLERIFIETFFSIWNTNLVHVINCHFFSFLGCFPLVLNNNFNNLTSDSLNWVKTGHRILKNHSNIISTNFNPIFLP